MRGISISSSMMSGRRSCSDRDRFDAILREHRFRALTFEQSRGDLAHRDGVVDHHDCM